MRIKQLNTICLSIFSLLLFLSCSGKKENNFDENTQRLFVESVKLIKEYRIKIREAKDSVIVDSLFASFDKRLSDINFSVPPLTDLNLNEFQNDSIKNLMTELIHEKSRRLLELSKNRQMNEEKEDSIYSEL